MRKQRKGLMVMEKPITAKYRTHFWYIAFASIALWLFLLYLFNSSAITVRNEERLFREEDNSNLTVSVRESDSVSISSDEKSEENNVTFPVSDDPVKNQAEDVRVINDIVDELEKGEENEKKLINDDDDDSFLGRQTRFDSSVERGRESTKPRSWDRLFPKKKKSLESLKNERKRLGKPTGFDNEDRFFDKDSGLKKDDELAEKTRSLDKDFTKKNNREPLNDETKTRKRKEDESESDNENEDRNEKRKRPFGRTKQQPIHLPKPFETKIENAMVRPRKTSPNDPCYGRYVYIHEIPTLFNEELIKNCRMLSWWTDMCELTSNLGLGPPLPDMERVSSWFATNQFTLEVIFHNRMKQYKCLTKDSSLASAVFVPYYAGLDVMRYLWGPFPSMRDAAALDLMKWLREKPEWRRMNGRDHFMVAGRTTWDFMRTPENESDWGNRLMILPEPRNMTMLLIESSPWNYHGFAIPYPTYFHPSSDNEILQWQSRMRRIKRRYLFSFVGAPRPDRGDSIRGEIMEQCRASRRKCKLVECISGSNKCYKPDQIMRFFLSSTFCLQPPGDSYTRRSTFDSILAGCIPVFFHPGSAYAQYMWHLPKDIGSYSVFIPVKDVKRGRVSIERVLNRIPKPKVAAMREEVIGLIPKVMYANPSSRLERFEDGFDVTIKGVLERVEGIRSKIEEGKEEEMFDFPEKFSWKYNMFGNVERHEWDAYFDTP